MIELLHDKLLSGNNLSLEESVKLFSYMVSPEVTEIKKASILTALTIKDETPEEIAGFALSMKEFGKSIDGHTDAIDVCGTGGDKSGSFNISTAVSFVLAGAGVKVAKHGNRSITSKSGSADVLKELGVNINLTPEQSAKALEQVGISFLFAPNYHPAMKYIGNVRRNLGFRTVFNMLGPLTNPATVTKQLIGVFNDITALKLAEAVDKLPQEKVCFVCTDGRYDELFLNGTSKVYEYNKGNELLEHKITNETFGYPVVTLEEIKGGNPLENAEILNNIFSGKFKSPHFYTVCANAALALYVSDKVTSFKDGAKFAEEIILSGEAKDKLNELIEFGK